jgi:IS5 family transposase
MQNLICSFVYRCKNVLGTNIIVADNSKNNTAYQKQKLRHGFRRRAAIEPRIGHLKSDHRLSRNFYKGIFGDNINVMLAAAAMNFKRMMNKWKLNPDFFIFLKWMNILFKIHQPFYLQIH